MDEYRVSIWPGVIDPPLVPPLEPGVVHDAEGEFGGPFLLFGRPRWSDMKVLPDELYLRELWRLDVTDPFKVAAFCEKHGQFGTLYFDEIPRCHLHDWGHDKEDLTLHELLTDARRAYVDYMRSQGLPPPDGFWSLESLFETVMYISLVRDMTRVWRYHQNQLTFEEVAGGWESRVQPFWDSSDEQTWNPQSPADLYAFLHTHLGVALTHFHVRPIVDRPTATDRKAMPREEPPTLYAALCLQLANHIAEGVTYRTCKKCGTLFVRQRGRAEAGQYRKKGPLDYCSKECSHAAMQKRYQDKKTEAVRLHNEGVQLWRIADKLDRDEATVKKWIAQANKKRKEDV